MEVPLGANVIPKGTVLVFFFSPALNRAKAQHACVLRPPERGGAGRQLIRPCAGKPPSIHLG